MELVELVELVGFGRTNSIALNDAVHSFTGILRSVLVRFLLQRYLVLVLAPFSR